MKTHIAFPSIEQFRTIVKVVRDRAQHDEVNIPTLTFAGSVKLHGTNASICSSVDEFWCQSRSNIISFEKDNAGFATYVEKNKQFFENFIKISKFVYGSEKFTNNTILAVYGEWCGQGIQKGVALSQLPKMFVVFGIRVFDNETKETTWFTNDQLKDVFDGIDFSREEQKSNNVYLITDFPTWEIEINFNRPELVQNQLGELTLEVEKECPVGKAFGISDIGEGIVWKCVKAPENFNTDNLTFKVKGEEHSVSKVKTLASVDVEKINSINEMVDSFVTDNRCNQGVEMSLIQQNLEISINNTGSFLKWITSDILKEEKDTIIQNGFLLKDVMGPINRKAKEWFITYLNKNLV